MNEMIPCMLPFKLLEQGKQTWCDPPIRACVTYPGGAWHLASRAGDTLCRGDESSVGNGAA
jgi:hypothetical protein